MVRLAAGKKCVVSLRLRYSTLHESRAARLAVSAVRGPASRRAGPLGRLTLSPRPGMLTSNEATAGWANCLFHWFSTRLQNGPVAKLTVVAWEDGCLPVAASWATCSRSGLSEFR